MNKENKNPEFRSDFPIDLNHLNNLQWSFIYLLGLFSSFKIITYYTGLYDSELGKIIGILFVWIYFIIVLFACYLGCKHRNNKNS